MHRLLTLFCVLMTTVTVLAQPKEAPPKEPKTSRRLDSANNTELLNNLTGDDAAARREAVGIIKERLSASPQRVSELRSMWVKSLLAARRYEEAAELTQFGILLAAGDTKNVEQLQQMRVRSLLGLGKANEALAGAKGLFNVATMEGTSDAILHVAECLNVAFPGDYGKFEQFRQEQVAGATTQPVHDAATTRPARTSAVLAGIKIEPGPVDEALKKITAEDYIGLMARGNLLLLADRVKEARVVFERMYSLAQPAQLPEASEALARVIKAEDGTIGRANSWVLSIRPRK